MDELRERPGPPWRRWVERTGRGPAWRSALLVAVFAQVGAGWAAHAQSGRVALDGFARLLLLLGPALLVARHRHPVAVVYAVSVVTLVYVGAGYPYGPVFLSLAVACFAAVVAGRRRAAWGAVGLLWAGHLLIGHWLYRWLPPAGDGPAPWSQEVAVTAWVLAILAVSELVRLRREQWARERAERRAAERRRVDEERLRIARELHDVLAHSISVINVQAGVGLALLDSDPEQARTALTTIKAASKEALGEVRQVLGTLRAPGEAPRTPAPGLDRLDELVEQAAAAGLTVDVSAEGEARALAPAWIWPPSASCRRRSPMSYGTPVPARRTCASAGGRAPWNCAWRTTARPRAAPRTAVATVSSGCASGPRPWGAGSRPDRVRTAASGWSRGSR